MFAPTNLIVRIYIITLLQIYTVNIKLSLNTFVHPEGNPDDIKLVYEGSEVLR
jgi:hypothetical protein